MRPAALISSGGTGCEGGKGGGRSARLQKAHSSTRSNIDRSVRCACGRRFERCEDGDGAALVLAESDARARECFSCAARFSPLFSSHRLVLLSLRFRCGVAAWMLSLFSSHRLVLLSLRFSPRLLGGTRERARKRMGMQGSHKAIQRLGSGLCDVLLIGFWILVLLCRKTFLEPAGGIQGFPHCPSGRATSRGGSDWTIDNRHLSGAAAEKKKWVSCCGAKPP
jgi:hypothetical protein